MNLKCFIISKNLKICADFIRFCNIPIEPFSYGFEIFQERVMQEQRKNNMLKICICFNINLGFTNIIAIPSIKKTTLIEHEIKSSNKKTKFILKQNNLHR